MLLFIINIAINRLGSSKPSNKLSISIVVAARNEEHRITPCLESLAQLKYPEDKFEVIFVDDHSTDSTSKLIGSYSAHHPNWHLISIDRKDMQLRGKKNALQKGISIAKGDIIFTTDADCIVPPDWLSVMSGYFNSGVSMVLGYSPLINSDKIYFRLLQFDNLFSGIAAAATAKLGYPFTSVGRNLAYRRDAYEDVGGFLSLKKFKSGDDIHLTGRFRHKNNGVIDYCAQPETFVKTQIPSTLSEVIQQQIRKNSKTFQLSGGSIIAMAILFLYYSILFIFPFILPSWIIVWFILIALKFILEFIPLRKATFLFDQKDLLRFIPLMQFIYPLYIILFSIIGTFQFYQWKK
jgi:cellulose synthase/poly-beta-1,6-N-acetylglucosamine synthase-like glycosyltransferase